MTTSPEYLAVVRRWCEERVAPRAASIDAEDAFFPDLVKDGAGLGLQHLLFGESGELALGNTVVAHDTTELVASYSSAVALGISIGRLHAYLIAKYCDPAIASAWVPRLLAGETFGAFAITEPHAGTDVRALTTVARRVGDTYVLSGEKAFITQSPVAEFVIVLAKLEHVERDADTAAFLVPTDVDGVTIGREEPMLGFRGMPMANVALDEATVHQDHRLLVDGFKGMMEGLNLARLDVAGYACGFLRASLRAVSAYARERESFGRSLAGHQAIQLKAGAMAADYAAARHLSRAAAHSFDRGGGGDADLISKAKLFASDAAMRHATEAVQIHGGYGVHLDYEVQRIFRDAKVTQIIDGTSEIHSMMIGRRALAEARW